MRLLILLAGWLLPLAGFANAIDRLKTQAEVTTFLRGIDRDWADETFFAAPTPDSVASPRQQFYKLDLDANGLTDLVVEGTQLFAVVDMGGTYQVHQLDEGMFSSGRVRLLQLLPQPGGLPWLLVQAPLHYRGSPMRDRVDTLVFKFGGFIERQPAPPPPPAIQRITLTTSGCFGTCPIFELTIKANRQATYRAINYNPQEGTFTGRVDTTTFHRLLSTLAYLRPPTLRADYHVAWTDDQTVTLTLTYADGRVQRIHDYGAQGTYGLRTLYAQLYNLRQTQNWY